MEGWLWEFQRGRVWMERRRLAERTRAIPERSMAGEGTVIGPAAASQVREKMGEELWGQVDGQVAAQQVAQASAQAGGSVSSSPKSTSRAGVFSGAVSWLRVEPRQMRGGMTARSRVAPVIEEIRAAAGAAGLVTVVTSVPRVWGLGLGLGERLLAGRGQVVVVDGYVAAAVVFEGGGGTGDVADPQLAVVGHGTALGALALLDGG